MTEDSFLPEIALSQRSLLSFLFGVYDVGKQALSRGREVIQLLYTVFSSCCRVYLISAPFRVQILRASIKILHIFSIEQGLGHNLAELSIMSTYICALANDDYKTP